MRNETTIDGQTIQPNLETSYLNFKNEITQLDRPGLETVIQELSQICHEFDPYQPHLLSAEIKTLIEKFSLDDMLGNPFTFTNNLLRILTTAEEELKSRTN